MDLVARVKGILLSPKSEWEVIDNESTTVGALYTGYIIPLAAIPAIAGFIGWSVIGSSMLGKAPMAWGLERAVLQFVLALAGTFVLALIIDAIAPSFGGQKNQIQALKVAAYSSTASWVAGIFMILPTLSILGILGLYSLYLLFVGLPIVMKAPAEKAMGYTVVIIICSIVLYVVIGAITLGALGTGMVVGGLRP
jgi:hypothetical protein